MSPWAISSFPEGRPLGLRASACEKDGPPAISGACHKQPYIRTAERGHSARGPSDRTRAVACRRPRFGEIPTAAATSCKVPTVPEWNDQPGRRLMGRIVELRGLRMMMAMLALLPVLAGRAAEPRPPSCAASSRGALQERAHFRRQVPLRSPVRPKCSCAAIRSRQSVLVRFQPALRSRSSMVGAAP